MHQKVFVGKIFQKMTNRFETAVGSKIRATEIPKNREIGLILLKPSESNVTEHIPTARTCTHAHSL